MKADVAEQFKAEKFVTERTAEDAEDAVVEESQIETRHSRKVVEDADTSVTTITVESEMTQVVTEKAMVIKATEEQSVSSVAETVLKHEVAIDRTCSTRSRRVPDRRTLLTS